MRQIFFSLVAFTAMVCLCALPAEAQRRLSFLRDAESERFFRDVTDPLLIAAELDPLAVTMYLINDKSLNAFVAGGQNIFIHSGLIMAAESSEEFIGVMAHETCHIACGHKLRRAEAYANAGSISILSMVLGAAAIAAGAPQAGLALFGGGQSVARGQALAYTRGEESEADLAGARYLQKAGYSADGLVSFFQKLQKREILALVPQIDYIRTHPLNRDRINRLEYAMKRNPRHNIPPDPVIEERFQRLRGKLIGYILEGTQTLRIYPPNDISAPARYARVYAYNKVREFDKAIAEANALIAMEPENPYFYEIKGQILFERGKIDEALPTLEKAVELAPYEPLIITALGQALVTLESDDTLERAIPLLNRATRLDRTNTFAWFNLARAHGYRGENALANLATAERYFAANAAGPAVGHARRALAELDRGSPEWIRAQDILFASEDLLRRYERRR